MLNRSETPERRIEKLERINAALIQRLERIEEIRGPTWTMNKATAVLEREVLARNRDLETALADLAAINAELATAREIADQANRAKSRFLRAASHDLLQPLSAAKLFLSHLYELSSDQFQREVVSHLTATIDSAEELIRALSNIAKLDSRSNKMSREEIAMGRLFRRLMIDLQSLASSRKIDLRFVPTQAVVQSDPLFLRQIVQNLVANALNHTTGRKVLVGMRREGGFVWLEVFDQGPGIAEEDHERIFNEFERLPGSTQPGTGLGLSIVRRACEQLDHRLALISRPGFGSRFRVRLPLVAASALDAAAPAPRPEALDLQGRKILVVENDPVMRRALALLLASWGVEVQAAGSIDMALVLARQLRPDLVLTDYRLDGGETGALALRRLSEQRRAALPAVMITAEPVESIQAEVKQLGVEVLEKPVSDAALRRAISAALAAK